MNFHYVLYFFFIVWILIDPKDDVENSVDGILFLF